MIWIASLCLLAVIAWLFFNGLNERRWVESHSHDETVAADKGILPDLSHVAERVKVATDGKVSTEKASAQFDKVATTVRAKTGQASEKIGQVVADARSQNSDTSIGRTSAKVSAAQQQIGEKWREHSGRIASKVSSKLDRADSAVAKTGTRVSENAGGQPTPKDH